MDTILNITSTVDNITILVENYSSGPMDVSIKTSKPDISNHGFCIVQMRSIALEYNSDDKLSYDTQTRKFLTIVLLQNQ